MKKNIMLAIICAVFGCTADAGAMERVVPRRWQPMVTVSLGPAWSTPGQTQTLFFTPTFPQTYVATSGSSLFGDGELWFGAHRELTAGIAAQLGLALAATTPLPLHGEIWQDNDPEFNNFAYAYKISHSHIAIRGKLFKEMGLWVQPYVSASLGVGFNHAYHYSNTPRLFEVDAEPPFQSHTTTALTYTLDIGIQKSLTDHWFLGMGYEFADWGKTTLGPASDQSSGMGLSLNHVYSNGIQFYLSFVA